MSVTHDHVVPVKVSEVAKSEDDVPVQFGFRRTTQATVSQQSESGVNVASHMPSHEDSGLGRVEYEECISQVSKLSNPQPSKKKRLQGTYTVQYTQLHIS